MTNFPILLDDTLAKPLYQQLYEEIRNAVMSGKLLPGQEMISTRALARKLGVSRFTVISSYDLLTEEGFLECSGGLRTTVAKSLPHPVETETFSPDAEQNLGLSLQIPISKFGKSILNTDSKRKDYSKAQSLEQIPFRQWRRVMLRQMRASDNELFESSEDSIGRQSLRESISAYLNKSRSITCDPDQVVIFSNHEIMRYFFSRILIDPSDTVVVEDPGPKPVQAMFQSLGAKLLHVPIDEHGLIVDSLWAGSEPIKFVYVTPSHHDPTGAVLPVSRRMDLLNFSAKRGALIVEDDLDSELQYVSRPIPPLYALDQNGAVIYLSNFCQYLSPLIQFGVAVFPHSLMPLVRAAKATLDSRLPILEQRTLTEFIIEGHLERHIRRVQSIYSAKRQCLIFALMRGLGRTISIPKESAGTHLIVRFRTECAEDQILHHANKAGLEMFSLKSYCMSNPETNQFLIPFASLDETSISQRIANFAELIRTNKSHHIPAEHIPAEHIPVEQFAHRGVSPASNELAVSFDFSVGGGV